MDDIKAKQEIVDKIKNSTNILVTVSNNPSVDALSAALGLTLLLDKLQKHATSIFSGATPPAIAFLQPEKTFDDTTDSLRDFIIALNKDKADHLRYKVDGDVVKIFITPYKTTITSDDLQFSQGDYNVELVIALGVDDQKHLDGALEAHGQILHDATVITVTAGEQTSTLGGIDWHDAQASSLGEMIAGLAEALKTDKTASLLDQEISTALLTGIVAQTDRFSNTHTTSRVMTVAAQLMAAGADQQLIAVKLQEASATPVKSAPEAQPASAPVEETTSPDIAITHDEPEPAPEVAEQLSETTDVPQAAVAPSAPEASVTSAYALDESVAETPEAPTQPAPASIETPADEPTGTSHAYLDTQPSFDGSVNAPSGPAPVAETPTILTHETPTTPGSEEVNAPSTPMSAYAPDAELTPAIEEPVAPTPLSVEPLPTPTPSPTTPASLGLPMPPAVPDFSTMPTPAMPPQPAVQPEILGNIFAPEGQPTPPVTPPVAPLTSEPVVEPIQPLTPPGPATPPAGQFRIPGQ